MFESLEPKKLWELIYSHSLMLVIVAIIGGIIGFATAKYLISPTYTSSSSMLVSRTAGDTTTTSVNLSDQQADVQLINTYKNLVTSSNVLEDVSKQLRSHHPEKTIYNLSVNKLRKMVAISNEQNSQVFSINVVADNPKLAADVANEVAGVFKQKLVGLMKLNNVSIIDFAKVSNTPTAPSVKNFVILGAVALVSTTLIVLFLQEISDTTIKNTDELSDEFGLINLGAIGYIEASRLLKEDLPGSALIQNVSHSRAVRFHTK